MVSSLGPGPGMTKAEEHHLLGCAGQTEEAQLHVSLHIKEWSQLSPLVSLKTS